MRSDAKASSAGSTLRQAGGLGRIVRGAIAIRGRFSDAGGSGAPSRGRLPLAALALVALAALTFVAAPASAVEPPTFLSSFGPDGTEGTNFGNFRGGIGVDQQTGDVYVDSGTGSAVGTLYKFDADGHPVDFTGTAPNINENKIEGLKEGLGLAIDSNSHILYRAEEHRILAFETDGEPHLFSAGPAPGTNEITGLSGGNGVAVDANGTIYVSDYSANTVSVFASTGEPLTQFNFEVGKSPESPSDLAVASDGVVYVNSAGSTAENATYKFTPSAFPVTAATTYTESPDPVTDASIFSLAGVAVDPLTDDVYVVGGADGKQWISQYDKTGTLIGVYAKEGEPGALFSGAENIAVRGASKQFYVGNSGGGLFSQVEIFAPPIYLPLPPTVESTSVLNVSADSAKLRAKVNPNTLDTTYYFEYGLEDCSLGGCTEVTPPNPDLGSGPKGVFAFAQLFGLKAGTTYHYRVVAKNEEDTTKGPDRTFTTQVSGLGFQLTDSRAWEMVSPADKHGATMMLATLSRPQAAANGEGLAYTSYGSVEANPEGNHLIGPSMVLARRGAGGWHSKDLTTPRTKAGGFGNDYMLFSNDLSKALVHQDNPPLSPQADEPTVYLRENTEPATYTPLLTNKEGFANVPSGAPFGHSPTIVKGATPQLTHVVFTSQAPLVAGANDTSLYLWDEGEISPISEKPAGEGGGIVFGMLGSDSGSVRDAISEDGSRVFWALPEYDVGGISSPALYLRDTEAEESVRLDVVQPGVPVEGKSIPAFQGASADGTVVFFTDSQRLTADASPLGRDLYRCEIPAGESAQGCATLTDLSAPLAGSGESASTLGIAPAFSEDGTRIYFFAEAKLDSEANGEGDTATAGKPNLYLWEEGEGVRFIATVSLKDLTDWGETVNRFYGFAETLSAAGSPSGRYLTFMSQRSLTGYDNEDAISGEPNQEVFAYDALSEELECASCNPSGANPVGTRGAAQVGEGASKKVDHRDLWNNKRSTAAILPQAWQGDNALGTLHQPRTILDNGRVFFNAFDSLVPADSNGQWDVYQYEPLGTGGCTASSGGAAVSRSGGGCVSLISSGTAEEEAVFIDTSASGNDAFFLSTAKLSVLDEDVVYDVYDARVNGVPAQLTPHTECAGEACLPVPVPPNDPTPSSASFKGTGNQVSSRCAKGKKRQLKSNGTTRCAAQRKKKKSHPHKAKRAAKSRRAGR